MSRKGAPFKCTYEDCTASFSRSDRLANHLKTHTGEGLFVCHYEGCDKKYVSVHRLNKHELSHETSFKCNFVGCNEVLKTKDTLNKHVNQVHLKKFMTSDKKQYTCSECDKHFSKHSLLQRHMFKHTGVLPYICDFKDCGKGFNVPSKLKRHKKTHQGYECKIPGCEQKFFKWSLYVGHLKEFHPKVHKCNTCDREFSTSTNLKIHAAVHEPNRKVFPCEMPNCPRFYFQEKNLTWHVKHYHDARPFACDKEHCSRAFKTKNALEEHVLRHMQMKIRKKKKPRPSFAAILSGRADPRKYIKKVPPKKPSESSDEFTTDDEPDQQNTSSSQNVNDEPQYEIVVLDGQLDETVSKSFAELEHGLSGCSKPPSPLPSTVQNALSDSKEQDLLKGPSKKREIDAEDQTPLKEPPKKRRKYGQAPPLIDDERHKMSEEDDASSSEYETITVNVYGAVWDKGCSGSDEAGSCVSEAEDILSCEGMISGRER